MSTADAFRDLRTRLNRVDYQLGLIAEEVAALDVENRAIVDHFDADAGEYVFRVEGDPPPPRIGLLVGETVHNLRATLDNLVAAVVKSHGAPVTTRTQFVITDSHTKWREQTTPKKTGEPGNDHLYGMTVAERALVESLQPYHGPGFIQEQPLFQLACLSNRDKHRMLFPTFAFARFSWMETFGWAVALNDDAARIGDATLVPGFKSGDYTEVLRVALVNPGPNPKMRMSNGFTLEVALSAIDVPLNLDGLRKIKSTVDSIVEQFAQDVGL